MGNNNKNRQCGGKEEARGRANVGEWEQGQVGEGTGKLGGHKAGEGEIGKREW